MARIHSPAIGVGRNSIGNITYRHVNGQTIASHRIVKNSSKTEKQKAQRNAFTHVGKLGRSFRPLLDISFIKNKRGSVNANFTSVNKDYMAYVRENHQNLSHQSAIKNLSIALKDPNFKSNVITAPGGLNLTPVYKCSAADNLTAKLYLGREFLPGDLITLSIAYVYELVGSTFEALTIYQKELEKEEIDALAIKNQYIIDSANFPELTLYDVLPPDYSNVEVILTVIVQSLTDCSASYFYLLPIIQGGL